MALSLPYMCLAQSKPKSPATTVQKTSEVAKIDSLLQECRKLREDISVYSSMSRYKLYPTENIYNFLMLDTESGQIWQIQWTIDGENEGVVTINNRDFGIGSFELYPTKNMYTFIMLDKSTGRKWHVQWGMNIENRFIRQIF